MKLSHPLSSLAPYAAGQEQERKEKNAAPLMHPSQRISRGIKWVKGLHKSLPKGKRIVEANNPASERHHNHIGRTRGMKGKSTDQDDLL